MMMRFVDINPGAGFATLGAGMAGAKIVGYQDYMAADLGSYTAEYERNAPSYAKNIPVAPAEYDEKYSADIVWCRMPKMQMSIESQKKFLDNAFAFNAGITIIESIKKLDVKIEADYVRTYNVYSHNASIGTGSRRRRYYTLVSNVVDVTKIKLSKRSVSGEWSGLKGYPVRKNSPYMKPKTREAVDFVSRCYPAGGYVSINGKYHFFQMSGHTPSPSARFSGTFVYRGGYRVVEISDMRRMYKIPENFRLPMSKTLAADAIGTGTDYLAAKFFVSEAINLLS